MTISPLSWIVHNWRLKLLALLLAMGMLAAVAFSENPPAFASVLVRVGYVNQPPDLAVVNQPETIQVDVAGLRSGVDQYRTSPAGVNIDLSRARAGPDQVFFATPKVDVPGVTARQASIPLRLTIEPQVTRQMDVEVRVPKTSPGTALIPEKTFATCGNTTDHCQVTMSGPASLVNSVKPFVDYTVSLSGATRQTSPDEPVQFDLRGHVYGDLKVLQHDRRSLPAPTAVPDTATVQVATQGGSLTKTVGVNLRLQGAQACGYAITGVEVQPGSFATVSGPVDLVSRLSTVPVDATINISGISSTTQYARALVTGSPQVSVDPPSIHVVVNVAQQFPCAAPTPTAAVPAPGPPIATPAPTPTARPT